MPRPKIKICCMQSVEDVRLAVAHGATAVGLVSAMPSGFGVIGDDKIIEIAAAIPPGVAGFLLTSETEVDAIVAQQRASGVTTLQLVDAVPTGAHAHLRAALPGVGLVQVIHVQNHGAVDAARALAGHVDALLLDSGNPGAPVPELGGTGRTHDWRTSRAIVDAGKTPPASNHIPGQIKVVPLTLWRQYCFEGLVGDRDNRDTIRRAFNRNIKKLQELGAIGTWQDWVWPAGQAGHGGT